MRERLAAFPGLTAVRLWRELRERGYAGGYTAVQRRRARMRPARRAPFEVRFETPPGEQAQVDLARFEVEFTDEPGVKRIVWLFSMVLGYSRLIWARFVVHQDLQSVLRCHIAALEAIGGAPREILYDRMKTAVIGEDPDGLVDLQPRPSRPRAALWLPASRLPAVSGQDQGQGRASVPLHSRGLLPRRVVPQPRRPQCQLRHWLDTVANPRVHATTQRVVNEAFAEEKPSLKPCRCSLPGGAEARTARLA